MGVLQRIRSGHSPKKEQQQQVFQGQRVASLVSQPLPPPPPPPGPNNSYRNRAVPKQHLQPKPAKQQEAAQFKQPAIQSAGRRQPEPKFPAVATKSDSTTNMSDTAVISQVFGPNANIYTDVLSVSPTASQQEIREAFFCLRYGIYQQLSEEGDANGPLSQEERKKVEMKMDAISAAFQILSDRNKRAMYDDSLAPKQGVVGRGGSAALPTAMRDSPSRQYKQQAEPSLSIGQKRSNYRRQMMAQQRRPIEAGAMNERKVAAPVFVGETVEKEEEPSVQPTFNARGTSRGKQISIKTTEEVIDQHQDKDDSPTGVDDFESVNKFKNVKLDDNKSSSHREIDSPEPDERTYDEDDRTYDDDSRTYGTNDDGEESYYTYGDATYGTYDDSTYVTYDDDQTYDDQTYDDDRGKYSPSHKTGDKPEPILKGSTPRGQKGKKKSNRRVTIHSHRGRGETGDEGCPFPGLDDAFEELSGTYKDFKDTLNQVGSAFILSPDDIDKMSDKIRDAQVELVENYEKQAGRKQQKAKKGVKLPKPSKKAIKN